jgi:DNA invertase Pin-like site-specific DNA recombinase
MNKYVSYIRTSTSEQIFGLKVQTATIERYVKNKNGIIIASYYEKESGNKSIYSSILEKAISHTKKENAILIVANLNRLSHNIMDIFSLKKDKQLTFEVCGIDANDAMIFEIFMNLSHRENRREIISDKTSRALAILKKEGKQLGNPHAADMLRQVNHLGVAKRKAAANENEANQRAYAAIKNVQGSLKLKANYLNENGFTTSNGCCFNPTQVLRLIKRYEARQTELSV